MTVEQTKLKPVTPEDFYSISLALDPQVHPKERFVAFVRETPEREGEKYDRSIWIVHAKRGAPRQFTAGGVDGDDSPRWSPDGKHLAFVSRRAGKPQIFIIRTDGGEAWQLTAMPNGAGNPVWSPDGKSIAFTSRVNETERREEGKRKKETFIDAFTRKQLEESRKHEEELRFDPRVYTRTLVRGGTSYKDDRYSHIYVQKLKGGKARRLTDGDFDFFMPAWTPDGKYIVCSTRQFGDVDIDIRADLLRIPVDGGDIAFLTADDNSDFAAAVDPNGRWVYYLSFQSEDLPRQRILIQRVPLEGGPVEKLTETFDYEPRQFQLDATGERLYFLASVRGSDRLFMMALSDASRSPREVISGKFMVNSFHLKGDTLAYQMESPDTPGDVFCADKDGVFRRRLTNLNEKFLRKRGISFPEEVIYRRPDGTEIQGWIMVPHGYEKGKKYPWVVQVHGGPHIMWGYSWWHEFQCMCGKGYGVFFCNPRGSDGYGGDFKKAIYKRWGEEDSGDILAGIDLVVERGLADPDKLYLTGGSFGGFMTAWIVGHDHRFKAAVAQRGVYDMISMYGASDANTLIEWEFGALPWDDHEILWEHSPLKYVRNIETPLMILHSMQDYRAGTATADEMYVALRRLGKEAEYVLYPREGHELSRSGEPRHRVDRINRIIGWFERHK